MGWKWKNPGCGSEYSGLYYSWHHMFDRVGNKDGRYLTYSDVIVCERWLSYDNFFEDMSDTWWKGATLDKDSILPGNRVYCKEYCKWVSQSENSKERIKRNGHPMKNPEVAKKVSEKVAKKILGGKNGMSKSVKCIETGVVYECCRDAERELNLKNGSVNRAACPNHLQQTAGGYHWEYI